MNNDLSSYKRPESALIVIYAGSMVLLMKRRDIVNFWQSVTGSLNHDESCPRKCALRELQEETGLTEADGVLSSELDAEWFDIYPERLQFYPPGVTKNFEHVFTFVMPSKVEINISDEHSEYCWVTKKEALELVVSSTNKDAIQKYVSE
jgi:dATP pyrophosphohydrolase